MSNDNVTTASTALGTIGTVFWCIQLVPQIWHNWRQKKTEGFPALMGFLWAGCELGHLPWRCRSHTDQGLGAVPMGVYLILQVARAFPVSVGNLTDQH